MLILAQALIFLIAFAGIVAGSLGLLYYAGGALNRARSRDFRTRQGMLAGLCLCGIVASAAAGFVAMPAIMYLAQQ